MQGLIGSLTQRLQAQRFDRQAEARHVGQLPRMARTTMPSLSQAMSPRVVVTPVTLPLSR
jgi:hypothetical protein